DGTGGLFARSKPHNGGEIETALNIDTTVAHLFRIDWSSTRIDYFVDGNQVASHVIVIASNMTPIVSDFSAGGGELSVDSMRMTPAGGAGGFTYTPDADFNGTDDFTYQVSDGHGGTSSATVSITVNPVNDAPVAHGGTLATDEDTPGNGTVTATDVDGDALTFGVVDGPAHGTLTSFNADTGAYTFQPAANYNGPASFTYSVTDGGDGGAGAVTTGPVTVVVNVASVNDSPAGADNTVTTDEDTAYTFAPADFGFSDPSDSPANALD